jgi:hypothetical protein
MMRTFNLLLSIEGNLPEKFTASYDFYAIAMLTVD